MKKNENVRMVLAIFLICALVAMVSPASAVGTWSWGSGDPNYNPAVTPDPGIYPCMAHTSFADFMGIKKPDGSTSPTTSYGSSGAAVGWDDTYVMNVGDGNTNGDFPDGLWAQIVLPNSGWWDLGKQYDKIAVATSQDHGPYIGEGLEYRIYGANAPFDDTNLGPPATCIAVYLDGWRPFNPAEDANNNQWSSDDITAIMDLQGQYRYIKLVGWQASAGLDEPEVDWIGGYCPPQCIPEFPVLTLPFSMVVGFLGLVLILKRRN
jgi:hypothetical protein